MATIFIDQQPYDVNDRQNLLAACLSLGFDLPYFCWHPAMGSVGACRQCAVKQFRDERDVDGRLVMACMTPASAGTRISIDDREAKAFRASVIEWLMANHPHDCPVCDEGGECHLQDMTVMTGHAYRRFRFRKRTFRNQYLGPFIKHDMNRCIECYRCVRFYRDYAGGRDFDVFASHNHVYFGRHEDGVLENAFSGNLIEVCPTGVFNDNTLLHHYTRKWDLQSAPSICTHCGVGCNTTPSERYGILRRITNRFNSRINGYWLCDRGRFGYEFVNSPERITRPQVRAARGEPPDVVAKHEALQRAASFIGPGREGPGETIGIGSPRASLEANFVLRTLVGRDRFCTGLPHADQQVLLALVDVLQHGPTPAATIQDIEQADAVLVLGEDLLNTAPRMALALLQSIRQQPMEVVDQLGIARWHEAAVREATHDRKGPLFLAGHQRTWLADYATEHLPTTPDDTARLGFAVAHELDPTAPAVPDASETVRRAARQIADALRHAHRPLVLSGTSSGSEALVRAAANVAWALHGANATTRLAFAVPAPNSVGLAMMGGVALEDAQQRIGAETSLVILEHDVLRQATPASGAILGRARHVISLDSLETATTAFSDVVLPAATWAEADGTFVNYEGRAQRFYQVFVPDGDVQESWRWLRDLAVLVGHDLQWESLDDVLAAVAREMPAFADVRLAAPPADVRFLGRKVPRQPERYSGRTAMMADLTVHEPKPPEDPDSALAYSMEGYRGPLPSPLIPQFVMPGWHSNQALNKFQSEVGGPLREEVPGVRLIQPGGDRPSYGREVPPAFEPRPNQWWLLPIFHVFGSEELSVRAPGVRSRVPEPYVAVSDDEAAARGFTEGQTVLLTVNGSVTRVPLRLARGMPPGTAGVPQLLTWQSGIVRGQGTWGRLESEH